MYFHSCFREIEEENVEEKSGRKSGPKKLFKWNQEIRWGATQNIFTESFNTDLMDIFIFFLIVTLVSITCRDCLDQLLREKIAKCQKEGKDGHELEEYLKTMLDNEVKPLWPKGWMQSRYAAI